MQKITFQEFLLRQPSCPNTFPTDNYFLALSNRILEIWRGIGVLSDIDDAVKKRVALAITGYFQDILSDAGLWRSFVGRMKTMYGHYLPFYSLSESYIEAELNEEDVRFMVWYTIAMLSDEHRLISPLNEEIKLLAKEFHKYLDSIYEDAPIPEGYNLACELDLQNQEEAKQIYDYGVWLFMHSYLLTPAYALTLSSLAAEPGMIVNGDTTNLQKRLEQAMFEDPTGPIALFLRDWIFLTIEGKMPNIPLSPAPAAPHPLYEKVIKANHNSPIKFFSTYNELNRFFIEVIGWSPNEEHLPALKNKQDFAILVTPERGMLVASDVCRCIAHPDNPMYDMNYAQHHAIEFLTVRGRCPADLGKYLTNHGYLPDAVFPEAEDTHEIVAKNSDFIMRCYLQNYYTD